MTATAYPNKVSTGAIFWAECKMEMLKAWRSPGFSVPTLFFPIVFYTMFGVILGSSDEARSIARATYMLATYGVFAAMGPSLFAFGVAVANERDQGWLEVKRAAPMPFSAFLGARLVMAMAFALVVTVGLFAIAYFAGGVRLAPGTWAALVGINLLTTIPFGILGLAIGLRARAQSAAAITNLLFFTLSLLGGLWVPITILPKAFATIALAMPSFHFGELALSAIGMKAGVSPMMNITATLAFSLVFAALAHRAWRHMDKDR
jgi:ABC-2 type transport system permease protein